jgi:hypothetical protein
MEIRISTKYRLSSDKNLLQFGYQVTDTLRDNPKFPDLKPSHAVLLTACDEFRVAVSMSSRKDRALLSAKNDKKAALIAVLDELAEYITTTCKGDKTMLLSSGFNIIGLKDELQELSSIDKLEVEIGVPGQATIRVKRVPGARSYVHQYTPDPLTADSVWVSETVTEREHTFTNLQSVKKYLFRVIAIGRNRQSVYSPPVTRVIQ